MKTSRKRAILASAILAAGLAAGLGPAMAQDSGDRTTGQYTCKDLMRESGPNRDVALAFLHGYLLGKAGATTFNLKVLHQQSSEFIEYCLDHPAEKAGDAMAKIKAKG